MSGAGAASGASWITVIRPRGWFGRWRRLKVRIDGEVVARLRIGESVTAPVSEGPHVLAVAMDWCSSPPRLVICGPGDEHRFCAKMPLPWTIRRKVFFRSRGTFDLELLDDPTARGK